MKPAHREPDRGRRAARWIVRAGLGGGAVCLLMGAVVYLDAAPDTAPATWAAWLPATLKHLVAAGFGVLGTMLVSVGAVFALLGRMSVLAAAPPPRGSTPADPANPAIVPATDPDPSAADRSHGPEPDQARATAPAYGEATGAAAPSRVEPHGTRAAGIGVDEAGRSASTAGTGPTPHHAAAPARRDEARPGPGVQSATLHAPADEAAEPSLPVDEPPPAEPPQPGDLIDAWDEYRRNGDGHFSPRGLQDVLDQWEFAARVVHGDRVDAGGAVLVVVTPGTPSFYVLPSFNKSPRAVADWFDDASSGALTGRTQRVARVARGRWLQSRTKPYDVIERGEVG